MECKKEAQSHKSTYHMKHVYLEAVSALTAVTVTAKWFLNTVLSISSNNRDVWSSVPGQVTALDISAEENHTVFPSVLPFSWENHTVFPCFTILN